MRTEMGMNKLSATDEVTPVVDAMAEKIETRFSEIATAADKLNDSLATLSDDMETAASLFDTDQGQNYFSTQSEALTNLKNDWTSINSEIEDSTQNMLTSLGDQTKLTMEGVVIPGITGLGLTFEETGQVIQESWQDTLYGNKAETDAFQQLWDTAQTNIKDTAFGAYDQIGNKASEVLGGLITGEINSLDDAWDLMAGSIESIWESALNRMLDSARNWAADMVMELGKSGLESVFGGIFGDGAGQDKDHMVDSTLLETGPPPLHSLYWFIKSIMSSSLNDVSGISGTNTPGGCADHTMRPPYLTPTYGIPCGVPM